MEASPTDRQPSAGAARRVGTWVRNKYRLDAVLGEGGMAVVYAATHRNKKRFAVKMLRSDLASAEAIRRFLREGYVANSVEHEDAVAVIDDDTSDDGSAFLVMELLDGESIEQLAARSGGRVEPRTVLAIAHPLLDVLAAAHAKGVVHRDIKPGNLFLTRAGRLKVLDFGIARLREAHEAAQATHTGVTMGTPSFMAPEQARGKASQVSDLTDVWAAGATMFTLLSGRHVHEGDSPQELVFASATVPPRSLAAVLPDAPEALVRFVDRALAFEPSARWPGAAAMRDEAAQLHLALFGEPVPRTIVAHDGHIALPASDPTLRARGADAGVAATVAVAWKTELLPPNVEALTFPSSTTGEPTAHTGTSPARDVRGSRRAAAIVVALVLACGTAAAAFIAGRPQAPRRSAVQTAPETTTTATAGSATTATTPEPQAPSASASEAPPKVTTGPDGNGPSGARTASAASHAPAGGMTAKRPTPPPAPRAPASAKASDWDRQ